MSAERRDRDRHTAGRQPALVGVHFFRSPAARIASRRRGELSQLVVVFGGVYSARVEGRASGPGDVRARAGDVVYWPANSVRTEENDPDRPTECIALYMRWAGAPSGLASVVHDAGGVIRLLALRLLSFKESPARVPAQIQEAYLPAIMAEYARLSLQREDPLVARVADYVEHHLAVPFTLGDLAAAVQLNRFYLGRAFKARTGMTPMGFVRRKRVEHAVGMLAHNRSFTIRTVAARVGVSDVAQFRRLLKRYTGMGARALVRFARSRESAQAPLWTANARGS